MQVVAVVAACKRIYPQVSGFFKKTVVDVE
jgi:hypothetical protein